MIHGNMPIGNSNAVIAWKTTTAAYAHGRVRCFMSRKTIVRSYAAPNQLNAYATHISLKNGPTIGTSLRAASQMRSGCASSSQSALIFASPANT
jgi:hypothetical protein